MKTLTMYHPNIQNALSDFDRYIGSFFDVPTKTFKREPAVDVQETENSYVFDIELPGFDEKSIEVHVDGANLTIASKKEEAKEEQKVEENGSKYLIKERRLSSFSRSFKLPENADPESVSAAFKNGVLNLQIKKRPEAQKRTIQINAA